MREKRKIFVHMKYIQKNLKEAPGKKGNVILDKPNHGLMS